MFHVNGERIEQHHFGAGELDLKLKPIYGAPQINIMWRYEGVSSNNIGK